MSDATNQVIELLGETAGFKGCDGGIETPVLSTEAAVSDVDTSFSCDEEIPPMNVPPPLPVTSPALSTSAIKSKKSRKISDDDLRQKQMEVSFMC